MVCRCRNVGFSRPGPNAAEVSLRANGPRCGEGGSEAQMEVAADTAEQGGQWPISPASLHHQRTHGVCSEGQSHMANQEVLCPRGQTS